MDGVIPQMGFNLSEAANAVIIAFIPLLILVSGYFVNRWLDRVKKRDADRKIEATITEAVALAVVAEPVPEKRVQRAVEFVQAIAPIEIKVLKIEPPVLRKKIEARVAASRAMVI